MTAEILLLSVGVICLIAAIVGGGLKGAGLDFPILQSVARQILLGILGVIFILFSQADKMVNYLPKPDKVITSTKPSTPPPVSLPSSPAAPARKEKLEQPPSSETDKVKQGKVDPPREEARPASTVSETSVLAILSRARTCPKGTYNVIVASGFTSQELADEKAKSFHDRFPKIQFFSQYMVASGGSGGNQQYAVLVGQGLNADEARILVSAMRSWGVAADTYFSFQASDGGCDPNPRKIGS